MAFDSNPNCLSSCAGPGNQECLRMALIYMCSTDTTVS